MGSEALFVIEPNHPSLAGHFPGRPVVPGVVVLDQTIAVILRDRPNQFVTALREVKFLSPVIPGDAVTVEILATLPDRVTFIGKVGQRPVIRGQAHLDVAA
jgi:3-hydroxymyristoyl/3-hydroxydecanoyl-(acyl carrier protein) dehydratase